MDRWTNQGFNFGNPAVSKALCWTRPVALRPNLTIGLPFSANPLLLPTKPSEKSERLIIGKKRVLDRMPALNAFLNASTSNMRHA